MPHITEISRLIKNNPERAHAYFEQHKKELFTVQNIIHQGLKLLEIFHSLQTILSENPSNIENLHNAINFYHQNIELLGELNIRGNTNQFNIFQEIIFFNSTLECQFHDKLVERTERVLRDHSLGEVKRILELISFALDFSDNSTAKINVKPARAYPLLRLRLRTLVQSTSRNIDNSQSGEAASNTNKRARSDDQVTTANPVPLIPEAKIEDCIIPVSQVESTRISFFNFVQIETAPSKKRARPEEPHSSGNRPDDITELEKEATSERNINSLLKRLDDASKHIKISDIFSMLKSSINTNSKTECADFLRELSRFCRKEALGNPRRNYALLHTARILSIIAVAWGNKHAVDELKYIGTKHEKFIPSELRAYIPPCFSSQDFPELLNNFLQEIEGHTSNCQRRVFGSLIEHLMSDTKLSSTLANQISHHIQVVLIQLLEQNIPERPSYNMV